MSKRHHNEGRGREQAGRGGEARKADFRDGGRSAGGGESAGSSSGFRLVCGAHPVETLLSERAAVVRRLCVVAGKVRPELLAKAHALRLEVQRVEVAELDRLAEGARHQGVAAFCAPFEYEEFDAALKRLANKPDALVVVLDSIQDPHNLGAIARSALAFGADLLVIAKDRAAQVTAVAEKSAAGALVHLPVARVVNVSRALDALKDAEFWTVGAVTHGAKGLRGYDFPQRLALVIGAEGDGMREQVEARIDIPLSVPLSARAESLNASNAAALFLYEIASSRGRGGAAR